MMRKWNIVVSIVACAWLIAAGYATRPLWRSPPASGSVLQTEGAAWGNGTLFDQRQGCAMAWAGRSCGGCSSKTFASGCTRSSSADGTERVRAYLQNVYAKRLNDPKIRVKIEDFGCHLEADIIKDGKVLKRVSVDLTGITEIG